MISALKKQGISVDKIATQLGRHRCTIYREFQRNSLHNAYRPNPSYQPARAKQKARSRLNRSRSDKRYFKTDFRLVEALLQLDWSPDQIVGHLKFRGHPAMSHELIYQYIWSDKTEGGHCVYLW